MDYHDIKIICDLARRTYKTESLLIFSRFIIYINLFTSKLTLFCIQFKIVKVLRKILILIYVGTWFCGSCCTLSCSHNMVRSRKMAMGREMMIDKL